MGKPEECAGLLRRGLNPMGISAALDISTQSVIDYLYRAVGKGYISTSDIVLSIPKELRTAAEHAIDRLKTDYWFSIASALSPNDLPVDRDLLRLYLHLRGAVVGDCYYLVRGLETALYTLVCSQAGPSFRYEYFKDLVQEVEANPRLLSQVASAVDDPLPQLRRANLLRNRIMHPFPPFTPSDEDFLFIRYLHTALSGLLYAGSLENRCHDLLAIESKLRAASDDAIHKSPLHKQLEALLGDA